MADDGQTLDITNEEGTMTAASMLSGVSTFLTTSGNTLGTLSKVGGGTLIIAILMGPVRVFNAMIGFVTTLISSPTSAISTVIDAFIIYPLSVITGTEFQIPGAAELSTIALGQLQGFLQLGALPLGGIIVFVFFFVWIYYATQTETPDWLPIPGFPDIDTPDWLEGLGIPEFGVTEENEDEEG